MNARAFWLTLLATAIGGIVTLVVYDRYIKPWITPRATLYQIK